MICSEKKILILIVLVLVYGNSLFPISGIINNEIENQTKSVEEVWMIEEIIPDFEVELFGYKLTTTDEDPIERDDNAILRFFFISKESVNIQIISFIGKFNFSKIPISAIEYPSINDNHHRFYYELYDYLNGFFLSISIYKDYTRINVAFDGFYSQLIYDGLYSKGFIIENGVHPFLKHINVEVINSEEFRYVKSEDIDQLKLDLTNRQENGLIIENEKLKSNSRGFGTKYGIYHVAENFVGTTYFMSLPSLWEDYTCVDVAILRLHPVTKNEILSDIEFYNKDYLSFYSSFKRDILVYSIGCHGISDLNNIENWQFSISGDNYEISPSEIEEIWTEGGSLFERWEIYPTDCLIIPDCCFGYCNKYTGNFYPDMGHAFVDYGAKVFIGSTISVEPQDTDYWMSPFWWSICYYDNTVRTSVIDMCYYHNAYFPSTPSWQIDDEWKILGNQYYTLPN